MGFPPCTQKYILLREKFFDLVNLGGLADERAEYSILGPDFARLPSYEYALMRGKEVIVDCHLKGFHGQAFTDAPRLFEGRIVEAADMALGSSREKCIFFATLNAVMRRLGLIENTVHCRGADAEECGRLLAEHILARFGDVKIAHIGYQPGHVSATSKAFDTVYITDLNPENVGKSRFGTTILDGSMNEDVIRRVDVACVTGSSIVNGTLFNILECCEKYGVKHIVYGVTVKGAAKILGYEVFCPLSRDKI